MGQTWPETFCWWIDTVGGFLVVPKPRLTVGQALRVDVDVGLFADISGKHATLERGETGLNLHAHAPTKVNANEVSERGRLQSGDRFLMRAVEMRLWQPQPWSLTARLELLSRHRLPKGVDAVIWLSETCTIGPRADAHIRTAWDFTLYVSRYQDRYWVRADDALVMAGRACREWGPLLPDACLNGPWGCFRWEPATP